MEIQPKDNQKPTYEQSLARFTEALKNAKPLPGTIERDIQQVHTIANWCLMSFGTAIVLLLLLLTDGKESLRDLGGFLLYCAIPVGLCAGFAALPWCWIQYRRLKQLQRNSGASRG